MTHTAKLKEAFRAAKGIVDHEFSLRSDCCLSRS